MSRIERVLSSSQTYRSYSQQPVFKHHETSVHQMHLVAPKRQAVTMIIKLFLLGKQPLEN
jgi:hypothetical protein